MDNQSYLFFCLNNHIKAIDMLYLDAKNNTSLIMSYLIIHNIKTILNLSTFALFYLFIHLSILPIYLMHLKISQRHHKFHP